MNLLAKIWQMWSFVVLCLPTELRFSAWGFPPEFFLLRSVLLLLRVLLNEVVFEGWGYRLRGSKVVCTLVVVMAYEVALLHVKSVDIA